MADDAGKAPAVKSRRRSGGAEGGKTDPAPSAPKATLAKAEPNSVRPRSTARPAPARKQADGGPASVPDGAPGPAKAAPPQAEATGPEPSHPFRSLTAEQMAMLERLSVNLAKAAITAQSAIAEAALHQADRPNALSADPMHVAPAMTEVMGRLAGAPDRLFKAQADLFGRYLDLWRLAAHRAAGEPADPVAQPARGDKRFNHPEWTANPVFDIVKQSYLITSDWLNDLVASVDGLDPMTRRRAQFFTKLLTDAFSPSNFLASNPAALNELLATQGESLVKGMERFAADIERGGGQLAISQTSYDRFEVGVNVATAPGKVVWRDELYELLQFSPSTDQCFERPLLIFPPWINKYYILDLKPENSMIRWLTGQGFTVFVTSWRNPDAGFANKTFQDYMEQGVYSAVARTLEQTGAQRLNAVGYCIGGTLLGATLSRMAAEGDDRIASATFFAAQHDFTEAGDLLLFTDEAWLKELEQRMDAAGGVLPGSAMADTFNALRANDLIWSFFINNYLMGKEPPAFDLLYWNSDQTRMPKVMHMFYLRRFYGDNAFARGELEVAGQRLDPAAVKIPLYFQASREDHIAPARSVYRSARLFGGPVTVTLAGSGHIAGVINPPSANKYQHWTNDALPEQFDQWMAGAVEQAGSWWPHWAAWLAARSGDQVPARDPSEGALPALADAPGDYVRVKS